MGLCHANTAKYQSKEQQLLEAVQGVSEEQYHVWKPVIDLDGKLGDFEKNHNFMIKQKNKVFLAERSTVKRHKLNCV